MSKHTLKSLDLTTLLVALDHVQEHGPPLVPPDPASAPGECVYPKFLGEAQAAAMAARLPSVEVLFKTPGGMGRSKVLRRVYSKPVILHVLRFAFPDEPDLGQFVRDLASIDHKYWRLVAGETGAAEGRRGKGKN